MHPFIRWFILLCILSASALAGNDQVGDKRKATESSDDVVVYFQ